MLIIGIITVNNSGERSKREEASTQRIEEMLAYLGEVKQYVILPDERKTISAMIAKMADEMGMDLVLTTGGIGISPRDITPEATLDVIERQVPGIPEAMRARLLERTSRAMFSRAIAGLRGRTLVINLPDSPKGVEECLEAILPALSYGLATVKEKNHDSGKTCNIL